ncbi:MAG: ABC transporter substrate-binding protein [Corynebacterium sp.]|nr:ABC transporter substrate-binding protein [Corynebacterium sp.]
MRRILAALGAVLLCTTATACAPDTTPAPSLVLVNASNPGTALVPGVISTEGGRRIAEMLYAGLVYYDVNGTVTNDAASSIRQENDTTYLVTLRDGQTFSNGDPVNAESFIDSWEYTRDKGLTNADYFDNIDTLELVDDLTFRITLKEADTNFVAKLGQPAFFPMPQSAFADMSAYADNPIGNGPYTLSEVIPNNSTTLLPNESYTGPRTVQNDGLKFVYYANSQVAYADLLVNNLDVNDVLDSTQGDRLDGRVATYQIAGNIQLVLDNALTVDQRRAISLAINRQANEQGLLAATDFTSSILGVTTGLSGSEYLNYDPVQAKTLWDSALAAAEAAYNEAQNPTTPEESAAEDTDSAESQSEEATQSEDSTVETTPTEVPAPVSSFDIAVPTAIQSTTSHSSEMLPPGSSITHPVANGVVTDTSATLTSTEPTSVEESTSVSTSSAAETTDPATEVPSIRSGTVNSEERDVVISSLQSSLGLSIGTAENDEVFIRAVKASYPSNQSFLDYYGMDQEELFATMPYIPLWYANVHVGYSTYVKNVQIDWRGTPVYYAITKSATK